jgi:hypothetical protein
VKPRTQSLRSHHKTSLYAARRRTAATVPLRHETPSEICFAHRPWLGAVVVLLSAGALFAVRANSPQGPWWVYAILAAFALAGVSSALWRYELQLDLALRRYRLRSGTWPWTQLREGSLDEVRQLRLAREWERSTTSRSNSERLYWTVRVDFGAALAPICIFSSRREEEARRRMGELAGKLGVAAADATGAAIAGGDSPSRATALSTDRVAPRADSRRTVSTPPQDGGIELDDGPSGRVVLLPAGGFHPSLLIPLLLGLFFAAFALLALGAALGWVPAEVSGSRALVGAMAIVFAAVGLGIAALAILAAAARERIEESGDALLFSVLIFGKHCGVRRLGKDEIEAIELRASTSSRRSAGSEVAVRSRNAVVVLGRQLAPAAQRWLREAMIVLSAG